MMRGMGMTPHVAATISKCAAQGMTIEATGERLGISRATVLKYARVINVTFAANKRGRKPRKAGGADLDPPSTPALPCPAQPRRT